MRESVYDAQQASAMRKLMTRVGGFFTAMMAAAAVFGAMSTLLVMVDSRRLEVATLRALGYPHGIVFAASLLEALLLGAAGGAAGAAVAYLGLNDYAASTHIAGWPDLLAFIKDQPLEASTTGARNAA